MSKILSKKEAVSLAKRNEIEELKDHAVKEYAKVLKLDSENIRKISLEVDKETDTASTESRNIYFNPSPDSELGFSGEYLLAEAIYEEVFHILTNQETIQENHGRNRKKLENGTIWDFCAHEIFGGFSRIVDEKWELQRSFNICKRDLIEEILKPYGTLRQDMYHYIGYKLAEKLGREKTVETVRRLSRMSDEELRSKLRNQIEGVREFLAMPDRDFGYFVDLDKGHYIGDEPVIFFKFQSELFYGYQSKEGGEWREYEGELPDEAKPKTMR